GSGKSTLIKMISGVLPYDTGEILINNQQLGKYDAKALAQEIAVLSQHNTQYFAFTVRETVALGSYAFKQGLFPSETYEDREIIREVMRSTGVEEVSHLTHEQMSGGEKQRVRLDQALAQEPKAHISHKPTNHLDHAYHKHLLHLLNDTIEGHDL